MNFYLKMQLTRSKQHCQLSHLVCLISEFGSMLFVWDLTRTTFLMSIFVRCANPGQLTGREHASCSQGIIPNN